MVGFGASLALAEVGEGDSHRRFRRCARLLRAQLHGQRTAVLGPDLSHRRTLVDLVVESPKVQAAVEAAVQVRPSAPEPGTNSWGRKLTAKFRPQARTNEAALRKRRQAEARQAALEIAADMSYPAIFSLERLLGILFKRIYERMRVNGLERITGLAETHTLIYLPSHRSHMDYLLLSLLLLDPRPDDPPHRRRQQSELASGRWPFAARRRLLHAAQLPRRPHLRRSAVRVPLRSLSARALRGVFFPKGGAAAPAGCCRPGWAY